MKKLVVLAAALLALSPFAAAQAQDAAVTAAPAAAVEHTLADGTKVVVEGDVASIVAADGTKTPAPDGEHKLADGTTLTVKGGKVVANADAAADTGAAE